MTDRNTIREQLSAYLDGELDDAAATAVEAACADDPAMAAELARLRAARDMVRHLPREKAPADFVSRVLAQAERLQLTTQPHTVRPVIKFRWLRYAATAAVAMLAFAVTLALGISLYTALGGHHERRVAQVPPVEAPPPHPVTVGFGDKDKIVEHGAADDRGDGGSVATMDRREGVPEATAKPAGDRAVGGTAEYKTEREPEMSKTDGGRPAGSPAGGETVSNLDNKMGIAKAATHGKAAGQAGGRMADNLPAACPVIVDRRDVHVVVAENLPQAAVPPNTQNLTAQNSAATNVPAVPPDAQAMLISTPDLPRTQRQVERALAANNVQPLQVSVNQIRQNANLGQAGNSQAQSSNVDGNAVVSNFYQTQRVKDEVLVITVVAPPEQIAGIQKSLEAVRSSQLAPQRSLSEARDRNTLYLSYANTAKQDEELQKANLCGGKQPQQQEQPLAQPSPPASTPTTVVNGPAGVSASMPAQAVRGIGAGGQMHFRQAQEQKSEPAWQSINLAASQPSTVRVQRLMITLEYRAAPTQVLADNAKKLQATSQPHTAEAGAAAAENSQVESRPAQAK